MVHLNKNERKKEKKNHANCAIKVKKMAIFNSSHLAEHWMTIVTACKSVSHLNVRFTKIEVENVRKIKSIA